MRFNIRQWFLNLSARQQLGVLAGGIVLVFALFLVLNHHNLISFFYRNHLVGNPPMSVKTDGLKTSRTINFNFTLSDTQFLSSLKDDLASPRKKWRKVNLEINSQPFEAKITGFNSYFKNLRISDTNRAFSLKLSGKSGYGGIRNFDLFQYDAIDLMEQELIYGLAHELDLRVPSTEYVEIRILGIFQGVYFLKQSFDKTLPMHFKMPGSVIFTLHKDRDGTWKPQYIHNPYPRAGNKKLYRHINRFFHLLEKDDPNLLAKYFDLDYMARFELLRELLHAPPGFVLEDNIKLIYNIFNGKFYPILDESNIYNIRSDRFNPRFELITGQIRRSTEIREKKQKYMAGLKQRLRVLTAHFRRMRKRYEKTGHSLTNRRRMDIISAYFDKHIFRKLEKFEPGKKRLKPSERYFEQRRSWLESRGQPDQPFQIRRYLDDMVLPHEKTIEKYGYMGLQFKYSYDLRRDCYIIEAGNHVVRENVYIPRGSVLRVEAGAVIKMERNTSLVSFSPVCIEGTKEKPVVVKAAGHKSFGVWAVIGHADTPCVVEHLDFSGAADDFDAGCRLPGGLNFHDTDVVIRDCCIHHNRGHDALNIKNGAVTLENNRFESNHTDHAALDYCTGTITNNGFIDDGADREGDCLDLSGSDCRVSGNRFAYSGDKALSIGEGSRCLFYDNEIYRNDIGLASKNGAQVLLWNNDFHGNTEALRAYRKDPAYGGGSLYLLENEFKDNDRQYKIDNYSRLYFPDSRENTGANTIPEVFAALNKKMDRLRVEENEIDSFSLGRRNIAVDTRRRVIFAALPPGTGTRQTIDFKTRLDDVRVYLETERSRRLEITPGIEYDFGEFIFRGKIILEHRLHQTGYDLVITTGDLPIIEIDTSGPHGTPRVIPDSPRISCNIRFFSKYETGMISGSYNNRSIEARIEGRGKHLQKWKYGFELDSEYGLEGMPASKEWVLESSFIEKSLMRNKIAMDWLELFRQDNRGQRLAAQSRFVEVILDGEYYGVYLLMQHIDRDFPGLESYDKNELFNSLLYRARNLNANFAARNRKAFYDDEYEDLPMGKQPKDKASDPVWGWRSGFEQRHPNRKKYGELWKPLEDLVKFTATAPDETFQLEIFKRLDRDLYIDLWIFHQLVDDSDGICKNRYIARHRGQDARWFIIPWDKDGTLGRLHNMKKRPPEGWLTTHLFQRCMGMDSFREAYKARWKRLRQRGVISTRNVYRMMAQNAYLLKDAQKRNFKRWPADHYLYPDRMGFHEEIDYMKEWIAKRIQWLDGYINGL